MVYTLKFISKLGPKITYELYEDGILKGTSTVLASVGKNIILDYQKKIATYEGLQSAPGVPYGPVVLEGYPFPEDTGVTASVSVGNSVVSGPSAIAVSSEPVVTSKIKLIISGIEDGFQVIARQDLPDFRIYVGDIPTAEDPKYGDYDEFENTVDDEYLEDEYGGGEEDEVVFQADPVVLSEIRNSEAEPYVPDSKYVLDMIPGYYVTNSGAKIQLCQIDKRPVNVKIAADYLRMKEAAARDGVRLSINSGFRSPYDNIYAKSDSGVPVSAQSQKSLYDNYLAGKGNLAAKPGMSNHGNGIGLDLNTGSRKAKNNGPLVSNVYVWLIKNSWKFGFVRSVATEEWHFDHLPNLIAQKETGKAYAVLKSSETNRFYGDLGLQNLG